jgi:hypothetical protein
MSDSLQRVIPPTLWLIVAPPLVALAWQLAGGFPRAASDPWPRRVGMGSMLLTAVALLGHEVNLARGPLGTQALVQTDVAGAHLDALDFGFTLIFDRLAVAACTLACVAALAAGALIVARRLDERRGRSWAWIELSLGGALVSFLAGGLAAAWLGWGMTAAAAAWLAGWTDAKAGVLRATRGALAVCALLVGGALLDGLVNGSWQFATPLEPHRASAALVAFLLAAAAMSAPGARRGVPRALAAIDAGATTGLVGPLLLLRVGLLVSRSSHTGPVVAAAGAALLLVGVRRAMAAPSGLPRWIAVAGGAPAGLTLVALGADGVPGGALVLVASGVVAVLLVGYGGGAAIAASLAGSRSRVERAFLGHLPESAATLLMAFERWVVDAIGGSVGVLVRAASWTLARFDAQVADAPARAAAGRTLQIGRGLEPMLGGSLARVAWVLVGTLMFLALAHALWPVP